MKAVFVVKPANSSSVELVNEEASRVDVVERRLIEVRPRTAIRGAKLEAGAASIEKRAMVGMVGESFILVRKRRFDRKIVIPGLLSFLLRELWHWHFSPSPFNMGATSSRAANSLNATVSSYQERQIQYLTNRSGRERPFVRVKVPRFKTRPTTFN